LLGNDEGGEMIADAVERERAAERDVAARGTLACVSSRIFPGLLRSREPGEMRRR
jgi:hypothetical protein